MIPMPHLHQVGKPYHPDRKIWPQGSHFNFMNGEFDLLLFFDAPTRHEIEAVRIGRAEFALYDHDDLVVLSYRFEGKRENVPWSDAPYQWHVVPVANRIAPREDLGPETRALLSITLVGATDGLIRVLRALTFSPEFTRDLFTAIARQAAAPYDRATYDRKVDSLYQRFDSGQLAAASSFRRFGGD
jgi:hypothetical protein